MNLLAHESFYVKSDAQKSNLQGVYNVCWIARVFKGMEVGFVYLNVFLGTVVSFICRPVNHTQKVRLWGTNDLESAWAAYGLDRGAL